mgnify:CR=1 FL=1
MQLRQIRYFVAVAETKSLRNAVERLNIAQPALSQSIKLLEEELGSELFIRSRKGMELTNSGATFLKSAKLILAEVSHAKERVKEEEENPGGIVNIALPPSVGSVLTVRLFREVRKRYPNIILNVEEATSIDVRHAFDIGKYDLLVFFKVEGIEDISVNPLLMEELYFVRKFEKDMPLPAEIEFSDLADYPLMFPQVPFTVGRAVQELAASEGLQFNILPNTIAIQRVIELVQLGVACSVVPWTLVNDLVSDDKIAAARVVGPAVTRSINMIYPTNTYCTNATLVVIDLIRQMIRKVHAEDRWRGRLLFD